MERARDGKGTEGKGMGKGGGEKGLENGEGEWNSGGQFASLEG